MENTIDLFWYRRKNVLRRFPENFLQKIDPIDASAIFDSASRDGARLTSTPKIANVKFQNSDFYVQLVTE